MKKPVLLLAALALPFLSGCSGCNGSNTDSKVQAEQELIQAEAYRQAGQPAIANFQERKLLKAIYELRDQEKLVTFVYTQGMDGKLVFLTKAMGYGVPYSAQYSNPQKFQRVYLNGTMYTATLPQAEPNGLFMPSSADATWILAIDPKTGETHPVFVEPRVVVSPFPLTPNEK